MKRRLYNAVVSRSAKIKAAGYGLVGTLVSLPLAASAQTAPPSQTYTLGTYGPSGSDYLTAAQGFAGNIGGILSAILGLLMIVMAVWKGPGLYKKLVTKFANV